MLAERVDDIMMELKIIVSQDDNIAFYRVKNDIIRFQDLTSVKRNHPELSEYIERYAFDLQRDFFRIKEVLENKRQAGLT